MKHPHLPQYFAIERNPPDPIWFEFIKWIRAMGHLNFDDWRYVGIDEKGVQGSNSLENFSDPKSVTLITLWQWKNAIDKTEDMKETEFKPGEYCRFENHEIQGILDTLRKNGHQVWKDSSVYNSKSEIILCCHDGDILGSWLPCSEATTELTREQFMFKATRGKGISTIAKNAQVEFDQSKPIQGFTPGAGWFDIPNDDFVGFHGKYAVYWNNEMSSYESCLDICNIEPFTAAMLEVGEYLETEPGKDGKINLIRRLKGGFVDINNPDGDFFFMDIANQIRGKRVKVNLTTEEI